MKVLVVGSGAREHAICWKLKSSPKLSKLYVAPGNPGMAALAELLPLQVDDLDGLVKFALENEIGLTIVGPEYPLTLGLADKFRAAGLAVFGPSQAAAQIEGSKHFAKEIMQRAGVKTAHYKFFDNEQQAQQYLTARGAPIVLKADGLAAGKGVVVCSTLEQAQSALHSIFTTYGGKGVVIEDFIKGVEASFIVATNGSVIVPLAATHDYKRLMDDDQGPNTGGMGSVSPTPHLNAAQFEQVIEQVIKPVLTEMQQNGTPFSGFLYAGLMIDAAGEIYVIEFNARLGDPECQSIMRRMRADLLELLCNLSSTPCGTTSFAVEELSWFEQSAVCLVLAAAGYPENPVSGSEIVGIDFAQSIPGVQVFHAGTKLSADNKLLTSGGRVLSVTALGNSIEEARRQAYRACDMIQFKGRQVRRDIGL